MSEKRDLWIPALLVGSGLALLGAHLTRADGYTVTGVLALMIGIAAAVASLPIRIRHGQGRMLTFGVGAMILLISLWPGLATSPAAMVAWGVLALAFLLPLRAVGPSLRILLLASAALFALLALLALFGVLPKSLIWLFLAGALHMALQVWWSQPRAVEEVPVGPLVVMFGGSFDPFHKGHRMLAETVISRCDRLLIVVAGNAPHKFVGEDGEAEITPFHHRVAMTRLGATGLPRTEVLEMEGRRQGPSYTVDTVEVLARSYPPGTRLRILVGADMYADFTNWHEWERILEHASLLVAARPGYDLADPPELVARDAVAERLPAPEILVSSTRLRKRLALREDVGDFVSPLIKTYIEEHGIYAP